MDSFKETVAWIICIVLCVMTVFGLVAFTDVYHTTLKQECRLAAIEQNYNAVEIQAICDRRQ
jgi:hypothetical protein